MLWTLGAFLLILSLLLVQFLKKVVNAVKKSYFVYPSDAVIDQALPQEIMEHVMTFLDPRAMMECRVVSKYWHHHAIKPTVEIAVIDQARQRLREVYQELREHEISIHDQQVESIIQHSTKDPFFVRASALAGKHGADLIVAGSELFRDIISHIMWPALKAQKKYFGLTSGYKYDTPWRFSLAGDVIYATAMFDKTAVDWEDTPHYDLAEVLVDMSPFPGYNLSDVKLYSFRSFNVPKYFYLLPLNDKMFHVLIFLFAPLIAHDALYSNYLPTIKSWFGQIMYIGAAIIQLLMISNFTRNHRPTKSFKLTLLTYITLYVLLTCIFYRATMSMFTGIGILALMFFYLIILREYFFPMHMFTASKKKRQLFFMGVSLIFFMIDWKLVVASLMDLTFFRALFENTFNYSMVLLMFIFYNFLGQVKRYGFDLRRILNWERHTFMTLVNSYGFVVLMTLVAPTWRGNY